MAASETTHPSGPTPANDPAGKAAGKAADLGDSRIADALDRAAGAPSPDAGAHAQAEWRGLKGDVEGLADVAAQQGRGLMDAARLQAQDYVERRKSDAAQSVHDLARTLRGSGKELEDKPNIKAFFDSAADGLEQLGASIERRSFGEFYGEAEAFARRAPVAVAVGTFLAGLVAARFIKASSLPPEGDARDSFRA